MADADLTAARLRELLHYDPDTGLFTWRFSRKGRPGKAGAVAGTVSKTQGYRYIGLDGRRYGAHRLAWLYMTGEWPDAEIDHRFAVKDDNRWSELRALSVRANRENDRRARASNKSSGLLGVSIQRSNKDLRYRARITVNGREMMLGRFDTPEEAHAAYVAAKRRLHPGCTL